MKTLGGIILAVLLLWPAPAPAAPDSTRQAVATRQEMRQRLTRLLAKRHALETRVASLAKDLKALQEELAGQQNEADLARGREAELAPRLTRTAAEMCALLPRISILRSVYARRLKALYLFGSQAGYSLLGSAADFRDYLVRSQYLTWTAQQDLERVAELRSRQERLTGLYGRLETQRAEALHLRRELDRRLARLEELKDSRQAILARLKAEEDECDLAIAAVNDAQSRLIRTFALDPAPLPAGTSALEELASPPVEGKVLGRGGPSERGVILSARPEARVRAPWAGKVAYAAALNGYGQVVVLDHGERVHTVLAHLGKLSVEPAQEVTAGQVVGAVGPAGRLYLEVRLGSLPVDPLAWLGLSP